jgi:excisionase family DNA binding protein
VLERLLTPADVAARLSVSRSQVYALARRGDLRAVRVGRLPRITEAAYRDYLRSIGVTEHDLADGDGRPATPEPGAP